jgi:nucleoside-diphosphate-sugar epimerase
VSALLDDPQSVETGSVMLLGSGVIGSAIEKALQRHGKVRTNAVQIPWGSHQRVEILKQMMESLPTQAGSNNTIVWAAGRAGFSADQTACDEELSAFRDTVHSIRHLVEHRGQQSVSLHLVSSAGGLYEGVTRVSSDTPFLPKRPYGLLKLEQEQLALEMSDSIPVTIHRVSTVYGCPKPGHRVGLIGELIRNGLDHRPISLYGAMDTLRDYVGNDQVGRHIATSIMMNRGPSPQVEMLVAGQPTPLAAVVALVERLLNRRLLVSFVNAWNAQDITFDPAIRANGFQPEALSTGVARVLFEFMSTR